MNPLTVVALVLAIFASLQEGVWAATPEWINPALKVAPSIPVPPTSQWPFVISTYMATCGAPWYANRTVPWCPHTLSRNTTEVTPAWPERPASSLLELFNVSGIGHVLEDAAFVQRFNSASTERRLMTLVLLSCEQFYVQWIVNATGGRYPPPQGDWDPRCVCADALDYTVTSGVVRHDNMAFKTPTETIDSSRTLPMASPTWYDYSNFTFADLGGTSFVSFWQKMSSINWTRSQSGPRQPSWRYLSDPIECRVDASAQPSSLFTVPQTSTRSPYFQCQVNPFGQGPRLGWGTEAYVACHQKDVWDWFWSIPPETLATRPAEYSLLRITTPSRPVSAPSSSSSPPPVGAPSSSLPSSTSSALTVSFFVFFATCTAILL